MATEIHTDRFIATLAAFFLAVGISAHALDELNGRPLKTELSDRTLIGLAAGSLAGAMGIGIAGCFIVSATLIPFVIVGRVLRGRLQPRALRRPLPHRLLARPRLGGVPGDDLLVGEHAQLRRREADVAGVLVAAGCFGLVSVQRRLSTPVRRLRRKTVSVTGEQRLDDGTVIPLTVAELSGPLDGSLRGLSWAVVVLAIGLVVMRY